MKKEDILSKSKEDNKKRDPYSMEIESRAGIISGLSTLAITTIFFVLESVFRDVTNLGLYAILLSFGAVSFLVKAIYLKRKKDIIFAVIYSIGTLVLSFIHISNLLS